MISGLETRSLPHSSRIMSTTGQRSSEITMTAHSLLAFPSSALRTSTIVPGSSRSLTEDPYRHRCYRHRVEAEPPLRMEAGELRLRCHRDNDPHNPLTDLPLLSSRSRSKDRSASGWLTYNLLSQPFAQLMKKAIGTNGQKYNPIHLMPFRITKISRTLKELLIRNRDCRSHEFTSSFPCKRNRLCQEDGHVPVPQRAC